MMWTFALSASSTMEQLRTYTSCTCAHILGQAEGGSEKCRRGAGADGVQHRTDKTQSQATGKGRPYEWHDVYDGIVIGFFSPATGPGD